MPSLGSCPINTCLLVAPVVEPGANTRSVYLPAAASWTDVRTGEVVDDRGIVEVDAPIGMIPVFARSETAPDLLDQLRRAWALRGSAGVDPVRLASRYGDVTPSMVG